MRTTVYNMIYTGWLLQGFLDIRVLTNDTGNWTQDMPQIETILIAGFPEVDEMVYIEYRPKDGGPIQYFDIGDHVDYNNNTKVINCFNATLMRARFTEGHS